MNTPKTKYDEQQDIAQALIDWFHSQGVSHEDATGAMALVIAAVVTWDSEPKQGRN